ncbi:HlyD family secretion protein [Rhodoblastus sp.]|uniref:HlyD family secretion protein n=1 Tax=Rhodoblastus sp. TaxID=1962975 RepID=UPI003F94495C
MPNKLFKWIIIAAAVGAAGFFGYRYWEASKSALPKGIASGNGRIEAKLVDIAAKEPLRVKEIRVDEGALVHPGEVLVVMDTATLEAELTKARLNVAATRQKEAVSQATIVRTKAAIELANIEVKRSSALVAERAGSQRELDVRKMALKSTSASLQEEEAKLRTTQEEVKVAQADIATIQTRIDDATLRSPVDGRVLYRLAEVGEVLGAGGKALTLVNLGDVYMEIFLPAEQAAPLEAGAEARIAVDGAPFVVPAEVSFVSPEAQFTPKQVETKSEREKLMFRVKLRVPEKIVEANLQRVKTGMRGVGYVKLNEAAQWPASLQNLLTPSTEAAAKGSRQDRAAEPTPTSGAAEHPQVNKRR